MHLNISHARCFVPSRITISMYRDTRSSGGVILRKVSITFLGYRSSLPRHATITSRKHHSLNNFAAHSYIHVAAHAGVDNPRGTRADFSVLGFEYSIRRIQRVIPLSRMLLFVYLCLIGVRLYNSMRNNIHA